MKKGLTALSALLIGFTLSGPVLAEPAQQSAPAAPQAKPELPDASSFDENQLDAFVGAQKDMVSVQRKYAEKLQGKQEKPQEAQAIKQKAQQEMKKVVKDSGLEMDTYNQIAMLARYDKDFRGRLQEKL